jgi:hypothetical protein
VETSELEKRIADLERRLALLEERAERDDRWFDDLATKARSLKISKQDSNIHGGQN